MRLIRIEIKKLMHYPAFLIAFALYCLALSSILLKGVDSFFQLTGVLPSGETQGLYNDLNFSQTTHLWHGILYASGFFKWFLGFIVAMTIANEFTCRMIRQNIVDGLSRKQYILSKVGTNMILCVVTIAVIVGTVFFSMEANREVDTTQGVALVFFYFLELFMFLSLTLLLVVVVKKLGLVAILLAIYPLIEVIIRESLASYLSWIEPYFPMKAMSDLIPSPFFQTQPIEMFPTMHTIGIVVTWIILFNLFAYLRLRRIDL